MRKIIVFLSFFACCILLGHAQAFFQSVPEGFDQVQTTIKHGKIDSITYLSKTTGVKRKALIYTPPGFKKNIKYPVLYLLHGIGGTEREWVDQGRPEVILDNLYAQNKLEPMIVVFPNGRASKDDRATGNIYGGDKVAGFANFENDLLNDLIPYVDKNLPVLTDQQHRAIAGLSMGGGQSLNFGLGHLDKFAWVGGFSSAPNTKKPTEMLPNPEEAKSKLKLLWISCGDKDGLITNSSRTHEYMDANNVPNIYFIEYGGYHDFKVWKRNLFMFAQLLFKQNNVNALARSILYGTPASTNVRSANYPRILPDGRTMFQLRAPEATNIQLDLGKKYPMIKNAQGVWEVTTEPLSGGIHYYSLIIDGVAVADPASETFYGMSRMASGIEIPFKGDSIYAEKDVPHGDVRIKRYFSTVYQSWRQFYIYTPAGYDAITANKLPVLYLLHGGGEDQRGWATQGKTDLIMDNLIAAGKAKPMLIVMLDGNTPRGSNGNASFESDLKQCLIPFVETNFKADKNSANRALAGLSMGGLQTLYVGIRNPQLFPNMGVFSSGWFATTNNVANADLEYLKSNLETFKKSNKMLWIAMGGKEDIAYQNCQSMLSLLDGLNVKYSYTEYPGGHTWPVWRNNIYKFAQDLFK